MIGIKSGSGEILSLKLGCLPATLYIVGLRPWCKAIIYLFEDSRCSYCIIANDIYNFTLNS